MGLRRNRVARQNQWDLRVEQERWQRVRTDKVYAVHPAIWRRA